MSFFVCLWCLGVEVGIGIGFRGWHGEGCLELFYTPFVMIPLRIGGVLRSQDRGREWKPGALRSWA